MSLFHKGLICRICFPHRALLHIVSKNDNTKWGNIDSAWVGDRRKAFVFTFSDGVEFRLHNKKGCRPKNHHYSKCDKVCHGNPDIVHVQSPKHQRNTPRTDCRGQEYGWEGVGSFRQTVIWWNKWINGLPDIRENEQPDEDIKDYNRCFPPQVASTQLSRMWLIGFQLMVNENRSWW